MASLYLIATIILIALPLAIYRLRVILNPRSNRPSRDARQGANEKTHLLIVLGSGGHTAEMIAMLERAVNEQDASRKLDWRRYSHRTWVVGSTDTISAQRATDFEKMVIRTSIENGEIKDADETNVGTSVIVTVPRAREIHQSILTAPISSLRCLVACLIVLIDADSCYPDVILCNGPATATILVFTSILLRFLNAGGCETNGKMRTIYVESFARVKKLSLSGLLLSRVVDRFLVQWPQLEKTYGGRTEYLGVLV